MPLRIPSGRCAALKAAAAAVIVLLLATALLDHALAQSGPFGVARPPAGAPAADGFVGWILAKQAEFFRALSGLVRAAKADGSAVWGLLGVSFLYGIFHAAGPGHGKAVISSYLVANEETWRRGVVLSFASALLQALVAILIVAIAAVLFNATAPSMNAAVRWIEIASYSLIALIGARVLWVKGRGFFDALQAVRVKPVPLGAAATAHHHGHQAHHGHDQGPSRGHDHGHSHDDHSGHSHGPEPQELAGPGGWQRGLAAIVAVGLRPCSGAILVLVFALAQGLFWAGVASTFVMGLGTAITVAAIATMAVGAKTLARRLAEQRAGWGSLALRGIEVAAAMVVLVFGLALLAGYMASERMIGV
jgi:ABC-type nickel/cobalt efflux system permease component RcnA